MIDIELYICEIIDFLPLKIKNFLKQAELTQKETIQETLLSSIVEYNENSEKKVYLSDLYDFKAIIITIEILRIILAYGQKHLTERRLAKILFYATTSKPYISYDKLKKRFSPTI